MTDTRTAARQRYLDEIASYLILVMETKGWNQSELARKALTGSPSPISRALQKKTELGRNRLDVIEERSGVPLPDSLRSAAIAAAAAVADPQSPTQDALDELMGAIIEDAGGRKEKIESLSRADLMALTLAMAAKASRRR